METVCELISVLTFIYAIHLNRPEYPEEQADEEAARDEDAELDLNKIEEDMLKVNKNYLKRKFLSTCLLFK